MTFQHHDGSAEVARLPHRFSAEAEFTHLMQLRRSCEERLNDLLDEMGAPPPRELAANFICLVVAEVDALNRRAARGTPLSVGEAARLDSLKGFLAERLPRAGVVRVASGLHQVKGGLDA